MNCIDLRLLCAILGFLAEETEEKRWEEEKSTWEVDDFCTASRFFGSLFSA